MTKEGVESGTIRTIMISHTIADVFQVHLKGFSQALNRKKRVSGRSGPIKRASVLKWLTLPKSQGVALLLSCMEIKRTRKFKLYKLINKPLGDQKPHIYTRPICPLLPPHLNLKGANRYLCRRQGAYEQKTMIVQKFVLNKLHEGTFAEAAGGLWLRGLWRDGYPGH